MVNPLMHHQYYPLNKLLLNEQINDVQQNKFRILPTYSKIGPSSSLSMDPNQSHIMYQPKIYPNTLMKYLEPKTMYPLLLAHMQQLKVNTTCLIRRYPLTTSCQTLVTSRL